MCILSDADITRSLAAGDLALEPFEARHLTPNGYDLTVGEVFVEEGARTVREGTATVPGRGWFAVSTRERVTLGPVLTAQLWLRTSYARRGVLAAFGKIEAGFSGSLTVGAFHARSQPLELPVGDRFCQVVFERMQSPPQRLYAERGGHYQGQAGVTFARDR